MSDIEKKNAISKYRINCFKYSEYFEDMESDTKRVITELSDRVIYNDEYNTNEKSEMIEEIKELMIKHQKYINEIKKNLDICIKKLNK